MAKGDDGRVRNQIGQNNTNYSGQQRDVMNTLYGTQNQMANNYNQAAGQNLGSYDEIMQGYRGILGGSGANGSGGGGGGFAPSTISYKDPFKSYEGYEGFSKDGGYSQQNIADMRARGIAPTRAIYQNMTNQMNRQRSLQGGYAPNFMASAAKLARQGSQEIADQNQNVNAGLAEAVNRGRLAGLGGMAGIESQRLGADLDVAKFNAQAAMSSGASRSAAADNNVANQLAALRGMTGLYGTDPANASAFGNQLLNNQGQLLSGLGNYGNYMNNSAQNQIAGGQMPGNWEHTMGRIGDFANMAGGVMYPWDFGGGNTGINGGRSEMWYDDPFGGGY